MVERLDSLEIVIVFKSIDKQKKYPRNCEGIFFEIFEINFEFPLLKYI